MKINSEWYRLITTKVTGRADGIIRPVDPRSGLEAWRKLWAHIGCRDIESVQEEYLRLQEPKPISKESLINDFLRKWELRLQEIYNIDPHEYIVTNQQKFNILMKVLPSEIKTWVDNARLRGVITNWTQLR